VQVSIHFPEDHREVARVAAQAQTLEAQGVRSGVNLLVGRSQLDAAVKARQTLKRAGIGDDRILLLPMRGQDTPSPADLAAVAGSERFQSVTCLLHCGASPRFASIGWDRRVGWCSYTSSRRPLGDLSYRALTEALTGLGLQFCGDS
jgi:hypothetical protein